MNMKYIILYHKLSLGKKKYNFYSIIVDCVCILILIMVLTVLNILHYDIDDNFILVRISIVSADGIYYCLGIIIIMYYQAHTKMTVNIF